MRLAQADSPGAALRTEGQGEPTPSRLRPLSALHPRRHRSPLQTYKPLRRTARLLQSNKIRLHPRIRLQRLQRSLENRRRPRIGRPLDPVVHPLALPPRPDHTCITQISQVPRDLRLTLPQNLYKVTDANLSSIHQVKQPKPSRISQRRKQPSHIDRRICRRPFHASKYTP